ncbi:hypothetical protein QAD02_014969 [Eretmocerus hayati]|uniref:Uncharacterized protein n=1 Tax=Eretmocerus hayati TaxID=131215 RepID=A0ACC2P9Q7_9HYME|nr:hypothetical protein QAD02_014969 [Eretmocerus hayati]
MKRPCVKDVLLSLSLLLVGLVGPWGSADAGSCAESKLCCPGRDSACVVQNSSPNAIVQSLADKPCYCDHACLKLGDCCDDFKQACGGQYISSQPPTSIYYICDTDIAMHISTLSTYVYLIKSDLLFDLSTCERYTYAWFRELAGRKRELADGLEPLLNRNAKILASGDRSPILKAQLCSRGYLVIHGEWLARSSILSILVRPKSISLSLVVCKDKCTRIRLNARLRLQIGFAYV